MHIADCQSLNHSWPDRLKCHICPLESDGVRSTRPGVAGVHRRSIGSSSWAESGAKTDRGGRVDRLCFHLLRFRRRFGRQNHQVAKRELNAGTQSFGSGVPVRGQVPPSGRRSRCHAVSLPRRSGRSPADSGRRSLRARRKRSEQLGRLVFPWFQVFMWDVLEVAETIWRDYMIGVPGVPILRRG